MFSWFQCDPVGIGILDPDMLRNVLQSSKCWTDDQPQIMWYSIGKHTQCLVSLLEPPCCLHTLDNVGSCLE
eukprot:5699475-Prorocentrum_lima.AAC.1